MYTPAWKVFCLLLTSGFLLHYVKLQVNGALVHGSAERTVTNCRNPNGNWGACIAINQCESLMYVLRKSLTEYFRFVRMSLCDVDNPGKYPNVCCTADTHFSDPLADYQQRIVFPSMPCDDKSKDEDKQVEFPQPPHCGSITISNKVYGGEEAEITEFSWMTQLEYRTPHGSLVSECAGSIINERYVLTAAHCVKGPIEQKVGKLVSLRVGERNTQTGFDCNKSGCIAPSQRVGIESIKIHEHYEGDKNLGIHQHNDIALLRMDRNVEFDDDIMPVCLPIAASQPELRNGMRLTVAGWGHNGTATHTANKQKVKLPFVDREHCRQIYEQHFYVADEQLCAGGIFQQDSCNGDSGGPLMHMESGAWMLEGIVSFGRGCGLENRPGIYTEVRKYIDWIRQNMEPY